MRIGTKSVLYGAHAFWLHPFFVAAAWYKLDGFPWDPRLWCAFFLHDFGYIGLPNMDGPEGEEHPVLGAKIMGWLFGQEWYDFTLLHSRHYAKKHNKQPSRLCMADKLVPCLMPAWLYLPMVRATGEVREYMENGRKAAADPNTPFTDGERILFGLSEEYSEHTRSYSWFIALKSYMNRWVAMHKDGQHDSWTTRTA